MEGNCKYVSITYMNSQVKLKTEHLDRKKKEIEMQKLKQRMYWQQNTKQNVERFQEFPK